MNILRINKVRFKQYRQKLIKFFREHGDKRITKKGITWLREVRDDELEQSGTLALCYLDNNRLIGAVIVVNYGIEESFIAVHSQYRNHHIGKQLIQVTLDRLGKLYGRVALDNLPSLKICLENNMVAFQLITGPTGKPTLWLGGGDWKREDILENPSTLKSPSSSV